LLTPPQRSERMSRIRGTNTRSELVLRRDSHLLGLCFRLHPRHMPGKQDIVLPRHRAVELVHGGFWHRHAG
jgi:DNA mismatch endonuclease (patch repair protein)